MGCSPPPCNTIVSGKPCGECDDGGGGAPNGPIFGVTSDDASVVITGPAGPVVDLSVASVPSSLAVALDGLVEVPTADVINFIPDPPIFMNVVEGPPGVANVRITSTAGAGGFSDYQYAENDPEQTTNNAAWMNVLSLPFVSVGGLYRLAWSTEVDSNGTYIGVRVRWQEGGVGPFTTLALGEITAGALHDPHGGIVVGLGLATADQLFEIDIQSGGPPTTVGARRTRLDLFRIGPIP